MSDAIEKVKCLIIGSGPAGYTAAIYAARADLQPVLYEGLQPGGQLTTTTEIENFPGYPEGITGPLMMEDLKKQAQRFGTDVRTGIVTSVDFSTPLAHKVIIDGSKAIESKVVIISTGATAKYLGLESETKFKGLGVSACATCDGFFYRKRDVAVVGGGDTAAEEATYLSNICNKVYLIIRKDYMRASKAMIKKVEETPNIEVLYNHVTQEVIGSDGVDGVKVKNVLTGEERDISIHGFFVAIGHTPNTDVFKGQIELDEDGYIVTKKGSTKTNISGVFAAGDVQDKEYRQAITAAGTGCMSAIEAERYLTSI